jgi:hypothetical protein
VHRLELLVDEHRHEVAAPDLAVDDLAHRLEGRVGQSGELHEVDEEQVQVLEGLAEQGEGGLRRRVPDQLLDVGVEALLAGQARLDEAVEPVRSTRSSVRTELVSWTTRIRALSTSRSSSDQFRRPARGSPGRTAAAPTRKNRSKLRSHISSSNSSPPSPPPQPGRSNGAAAPQQFGAPPASAAPRRGSLDIGRIIGPSSRHAPALTPCPGAAYHGGLQSGGATGT